LEAIGIITEYNPFHKGHLRQIDIVKTHFPGSPVICVMSGNFVQRGEPAIWNKFVRARAALLCGADMIIELPVPFATASAEYFAHYGLSLLNSLGFVKYLCFGSENDDLEILKKTAEILVMEPYGFKSELKARLILGDSYPAARHKALEHLMPALSDILNKPNNILGIEYIKAIMRLGSNIKPFAIKREGEGYHSSDYTKELSSAKAIREALRAGKCNLIGLPEKLKPLYDDQIKKGDYHDFDRLGDVLQYIVKTSPPEKLAKILDVDEGLHHRIIDILGSERLISKSLWSLKSKRYTYTRLSRALLHILLDITTADFNNFYESGPNYVRVLGFRKEWESLFSYINTYCPLPIITNIKNYHTVLSPIGKELLEKEIRSTDIYNLSGINPAPKNAEFSESIVVV